MKKIELERKNKVFLHHEKRNPNFMVGDYCIFSRILSCIGGILTTRLRYPVQIENGIT